MTTGVGMKPCIFLDQRASLVAVEPRHHDVDKDQVRLMVGDLGQRVETVLGQDDRAPGLKKKNLGASTNRVAVVDDHDFDARQSGWIRQAFPPTW